MKPPNPLTRGEFSPDHHYLRFNIPGQPERGERVFAFPHSLNIQSCIQACRGLLPTEWKYLEPDDGYGRVVTQQEIDRWTRDDLAQRLERVEARAA